MAEVQVWAAAAKLEWLVTDHLGTSRMVVDKTGSLAGVSRHDYLPFGEEIYNGERSSAMGYAANDTTRQKFTEKERDAETGLDYFVARYYSSTQGRFTSADPVAGLSGNPQSLNAYTYTWNNPLKLTDPSGMTVSWEDSKKKQQKNETEARTNAQREYENLIKEKLGSKDAKARAEGQRMQASYEQLQKSDTTFHVVKDSSNNSSSGELSYAGQPGHLYINLKGDTGAYGAMTDNQKLAHEFKHGVQFLNGQLGFVQDSKGNWLGYKDDLVDEAEAFTAGFEAQPLDPAQKDKDFLKAIDRAMPYGIQSVVQVLDRIGPYRGRSTTQLPITSSDLKDPHIYAVPRKP